MACNHTYRDYTKMTVEEMVSYISEDNYRDGALACSVRGAFVGNEEK